MAFLIPQIHLDCYENGALQIVRKENKRNKKYKKILLNRIVNFFNDGPSKHSLNVSNLKNVFIANEQKIT